MNLKERARMLKTDIPTLFLALKDKETPIVTKVFVGITVAYALSPIDLVPDFIPVLGYLMDDIKRNVDGYEECKKERIIP